MTLGLARVRSRIADEDTLLPRVLEMTFCDMQAYDLVRNEDTIGGRLDLQPGLALQQPLPQILCSLLICAVHVAALHPASQKGPVGVLDDQVSLVLG